MLLALALTSAAAGAQSQRARVVLPGFVGAVTMDTTGLMVRYASPREKTLQVAAEALAELGMEVQRDDALGIVGNTGLKVVRRFAGYQLSQLLDCGARDRGPNADFYRVNMALLALVTAARDDSTELRFAFAAGAQSLGGGLGDPVSCSSSGKLEERLFAFATARLGRGTAPTNR